MARHPRDEPRQAGRPEHVAARCVMTVSLLHILAAYVATSLTVGLLLGVMLGRLIRRGDRRRRQEVALLARARAAQGFGSRHADPPAVGSGPVAQRDDARRAAPAARTSSPGLSVSGSRVHQTLIGGYPGVQAGEEAALSVGVGRNLTQRGASM